MATLQLAAAGAARANRDGGAASRSGRQGHTSRIDGGGGIEGEGVGALGGAVAVGALGWHRGGGTTATTTI